MNILVNKLANNNYFLSQVRNIHLNQKERENLAILHWFINFNYEKKRGYIQDGIDYVDISKEEFCQVLPKNSSDNSKGYVELKRIAVEELKTIKENGRYCFTDNSFTKSYRLQNRESLDKIVLFEIKDKANIRRLKKYLIANVDNDPICRNAKEISDRCTIKPEAVDFIRNQDWSIKKKSHALWQIMNFNLQNSSCKRFSKVKRITTNVTNLYKDMIPFIQFDGRDIELMELDISAMLPLVLAIRLQKEEQTDDIREFISMALDSGDFYSALKKRFYLREMDRNEVKRCFYKHFLNVYSKSHLNEFFREEFPNVFKYMFREIETHKTNINILLMTDEAEINIDIILKSLFDKLPEGSFVQSKHDAWLFEKKDREIVEQEVKRAYKEHFGIDLKRDINFRITSLSDEAHICPVTNDIHATHVSISKEATSEQEPANPEAPEKIRAEKPEEKQCVILKPNPSMFEVELDDDAKRMMEALEIYYQQQQ